MFDDAMQQMRPHTARRRSADALDAGAGPADGASCPSKAACACAASAGAKALDMRVRVLMTGVTLGCRTSFARLYECTASRLFAIVSAIVPEREDAESLLQDLYVRLWDNRAGAAQPRGMHGLVALARGVAVDSGLRRTVRPRTASSFVPARTRGAFREALSAASPRALRSCLCALPEGQRQALIFAFYEGFGNDEIAALLGQEVGTIKTWLSKAIATFPAGDAAA